MSSSSYRVICPYHPHGELIEDWRAGDIICRECGRVAGERMIDVSNEWRDFANNDSESVSRSRVGAAQNLLYDTANLETITVGRKGSSMTQESNLPTSNNRISQPSSTDIALRTAQDSIRNIASRINLTRRVTDRAFLIYKNAHAKKLVRGRSRDIYVATCIYMACREESSTRTMDEIASVAAISQSDISRTYRKLIRNLPQSTEPKIIQLKDLIPRFVSRLELVQTMPVRNTAIYIAEQAKEICDIQGRKPSSVAGASIYLACLALNENVNRKDIHQAVGASEAVIRAVYQILLPHANQLFPNGFVFKRPINNLPSF